VLFKNDRKSDDRHPDYTGSLNVDGVDYYLDAWVKQGAKGKFFSGRIKAKGATQAAASPKQWPEPKPDLGDDDIPF
jgi:hypothetical protein